MMPAVPPLPFLTLGWTCCCLHVLYPFLFIATLNVCFWPSLRFLRFRRLFPLPVRYLSLNDLSNRVGYLSGPWTPSPTQSLLFLFYILWQTCPIAVPPPPLTMLDCNCVYVCGFFPSCLFVCSPNAVTFTIPFPSYLAYSLCPNIILFVVCLGPSPHICPREK